MAICLIFTGFTNAFVWRNIDWLAVIQVAVFVRLWASFADSSS
jgi:hypothetical protein